MYRRFQLVRMLSLAAFVGLATEGPMGQKQSVQAQESDRSRSDDESRDERRDRYRRSFGDRGRDYGRGSRDDDERRRDESSSSSSSNSGSTSTPSGTAGAPSLNMSVYASSLVKQHDKNGNMMLEAEERKELRGRAADSDLNKDNVITVDELVAHLSGGAPAAPPSTSSSTSSTTGGESSRDRDRSGGFSFRRRDGDSNSSDRSRTEADAAKRVLTGTAGGIAATTKEGDKRRSYRFSTAAERLPKGLPSFFSRDKNGNGQIEMSEYSQSWSKSTVAEFQRLDLNSDGVITSKEAAKK